MRSHPLFKMMHQECDEIVYRQAFACQHQQEDGSWLLDSKELVYFHIDQLVDGLLEVSESVTFWLSPANKSNFRFGVVNTAGPCGMGYKHGRGIKPFYYEIIRQYFKTQYGAEEIEGFEADDALGMNRCPRLSKDVILSHIDKDIDMIPGWHYDWTSHKTYFHNDVLGHLSLENQNKKLKGSNLKFFYAQLLTGDRVDNIPGIKGLGPVKVFKLLESFDSEFSLLTAVVEEYKKQYQDKWQEVLLEIADLIWICRNKHETGRQYLLSKGWL